jgi:glycerophosphoryl diester phosphodiesterase
MNSLTDLTARPVIGHRGASGCAPENTLQAFELAVRQGADAVELDVRLTRDGVPVIMHDPTLERTTGLRISAADLTATELKRLDAGARFSLDKGRSFPFRGTGVVIPTLMEVLRALPHTPLLLDLKEPAAQEAVRSILLEEQAVNRCVLASADAGALAGFGAEPFVRAASRREVSQLYWGAILRTMSPASWARAISPPGYRLLSVPVRYRGLRVPTRSFVAAARARGCPVHVWTVNDSSIARRLWRSGVAGILTDLPSRIQAVR